MVHIGRVVVRMLDAPMSVPVRVLADNGRIVRVVVMTIVVPMRVVVLYRVMRVLVLVFLGEMQVDADRKPSRGEGRQ